MAKIKQWTDQFLGMLFPLDSREIDIEGAFMFKNKHLPKSIFKYREVNEYSLRNLKEDTVWLADPSNFNDPYDCAHTVDLMAVSRVRAKEFLPNFFKERGLEEQLGKDVLEEMLHSADPLVFLMDVMLFKEPEDKKEVIKSAILAAQSKLNEDIVRNSSKHISSSFKLCSFSERNDSMLMWSHYADYHRGFCLEYNLEDVSYKDYRTRFLYPVIYSDKIFNTTEYALHCIDNTSFNNLYLSMAALFKAFDWQYEKEWRLVFGSGLFDEEQSYYMGKPKTLYLGTKIKPEDQDVLTAICKTKSIQFYKMKAHAYEFKVEPTTIKDADQCFFKG